MIRVGINGFGRIGRCVLRALYERGCEEVRVVAINEPASVEAMAYLLRHDTTHGRFGYSVEHQGDALIVAGDRIRVTHGSTPAEASWGAADVDLVIESSGTFADRATAELHLAAGAKRLIFSQPADADVDATIVYGVNQRVLSANHRIVSAASCTTNCIVPLLAFLDREFGIHSGLIRTLHAAMNDQPVIDAYHHADLRRNRAAFESMIPVETALVRGIGRILPQLEERIEARALRLPISDVSAMDIGLVLKRDTDLDEVEARLIEAADTQFDGVMGYTREPLVSCDFVHDSRSLVVDLQQVRLSGSRHLGLLAWFDNEWGYANRILDTLIYWPQAHSAN